MNKYWSIFKISFQQEFTYKSNFIMWRLRNIFRIIVTYFLWNTVFAGSSQIFFGYNRSGIFTYVFSLMAVIAIVSSARSQDIVNDIASGDLSNYLVKPINYFKYWFTRDMASKVLNLAFAAIEFSVLFYIFKPDLYFQNNIYSLLAFFVSLIIATAIFFYVTFIISSVPFWAPELGWPSQFLVTIVIVEFLSGALFPIDILPAALQKVLMLTPFPYMVFFPIQVYLGKLTGAQLMYGFLISIIWAFVLWFLLKVVWQNGLKAYGAFGR
jgi:ABC-2 type transport system permease protein